ncbi:ribosome silencing factor [Lampropedia aestuarii]|uniref:ribosome silencing factor n=1 Tax=Lampropedia aestuarii TaxID=2562762 RepID=UPI002468C957|nr:ribosome silencing factor [Lampropedia aestuarii]MDH5858018.1 ribosome silencing factor [Lampropedia aestuarii]
MKTISESGAKRQVSTLQAAIVDGLEDVKGQNIQVFDTTHLSPLFERVIVASATSSRQTKALAASVRDKVREAGFDKPRTEGEENGEWVVVDCGAIVAHIMQPAIREYYRLEEIWGDKPVKAAIKAAKIQAAKAAKAAQAEEGDTLPPAKKTAAKKTTAAGTAGKPVVKKAASKSAAATTAEPKKPAAKKVASKTAASKTAASATAVKKSAAKTAAKTAVKKVTVNAETVKKAAAKKPAATKAATKSAAPKAAAKKKA